MVTSWFHMAFRPVRQASLLCALTAGALSIAVGPSLAQQTAPDRMGSEPTIIVEGFGEASRAPDEARITFTVLRTGETARAAVDAGNSAMRAVIDGMRELGAADRDLQTANFQISPRYSNPPQEPDGQQRDPEIVGYEARNTLTVIVRSIDQVGAFLDEAVDLGVNQGGDVSFSLADDKPLLDEARRAAVDDGADKAALFAEAASVELGPLLRIEESPRFGINPPDMPMMRMSAAEAAVPVEPGELTMSATVRMVYGIGNGGE